MSLPPGLVAAANVNGQRLWEIVIAGHVGTTLIRNVFHMYSLVGGGGPSSWNKVDLATAIVVPVGSLLTNYLACLNVSYVHDYVATRNVTDPMDPYNVNVAAAGNTGAIAGDFQPTFSAAVVRWTTPAYRGRTFARAAMHLSPIAESSTLGQQITAGFQATLVAFANAASPNGFLNNVVDALGNLYGGAVLSRKYSDKPIGSGVVAYWIPFGYAIPPRLGTMKHRRAKP